MFCPLKGSACSPRRWSTRHSAAVISDLPAPLEVPSTIRGRGVVPVTAASADAGCDADAPTPESNAAGVPQTGPVIPEQPAHATQGRVLMFWVETQAIPSPSPPGVVAASSAVTGAVGRHQLPGIQHPPITSRSTRTLASQPQVVFEGFAVAEPACFAAGRQRLGSLAAGRRHARSSSSPSQTQGMVSAHRESAPCGRRRPGCRLPHEDPDRGLQSASTQAVPWPGRPGRLRVFQQVGGVSDGQRRAGIPGSLRGVVLRCAASAVLASASPARG